MGINNLNWLNNSYTKNQNKPSSGGNGGPVDTSKFVTRNEFYGSQGEQDKKIQSNITAINDLKNEFNALDFSEFVTQREFNNARSDLSNRIMENKIEIDANQSLINDIHNQFTIHSQTTNGYFQTIDQKIEQNTAEIEAIKQNQGGGNGNIDTSQFINKTDFEKSQKTQDDKILTNQNEIKKLKQDTTNTINGLAKLGEPNRFTDENIFAGGVCISNRPLYIGPNQSNQAGIMYDSKEKQVELWNASGGSRSHYTPKTQSSIVNKDYVDTTIEPLQQSINQNQTQIAQNTADILDLKNRPNGGGGNVDLSNYYTKPETNNLISPINNRVDEAYTKIRENNNNITKLQNEKQDKLIAGSGIEIVNNTISLGAALQPPPDMSNYYTIEQWDQLYQGMEITSSAPIITQFNKKALMVFEISTDNIKLADFIGNLPTEIASWRNIANVESAMVNAINVDGDILSKQLDLLISHYNGRLFIKSYGNLPSDVKKIRFRIWVNKR